MTFFANKIFYQCQVTTVSLVSVLLIVLTVVSYCYCDGNDCCFWRQKHFDTESGKVELNWMVDSVKQTITFEIVSDSDTVSFGFTHDGNLSYPFDFVIGGVDENGNEILLDMVAHFQEDSIHLKTDAEQDYHLLGIEKVGPSMKIRFYRKWDTGDFNDLQFDSSLVQVIWLSGRMEKGHFHLNEVDSLETTINVFKIYILEPRVNSPAKDVESWHFVQRGFVLPNKSTTYWCTLHKTTQLQDKYHVIGFRTLLNSKLERKHTHHIVLYKCDAISTSEAESTFDPFVITSGNNCYESLQDEGGPPVQKCRTFMYVWAYGGEDFFFPNDVGYPIGEKETEYYLLEVHYDNPELLSGLVVHAGVEIILTKEIRQNDAGLFMIGYDISPSLILPSQKEDIMITGHCKASCTNDLLPVEGIQVFGVLLHSHKLGRRMKLLQSGPNKFNRIAQEISQDDFYDFSFQQSRLLSERKIIGPGDTLTMQCHYSSLQVNVNTTLGGFSTRDEMCLGFLWYFPKIQNLKACLSVISMSDIMTNLGINKSMQSSESILKKWPRNDSLLKNVVDKEIHNVDVWNRIAHLYDTYESHIALC